MSLKVAVLVSAMALTAPVLTGCDSANFGERPIVTVSWGQLQLTTGGEVVFRGATPREIEYEERVTIKNVGSSPLRIASITLDGDQSFALSSDTPQTINLQPQGSTDVVVMYKAEDLESREATLVVNSNDREKPRVAVRVRNDDVFPSIVVSDCVQATATDGGVASCRTPTDDLLVDFGQLRPAQCRSGEVIVENTGKAELVIEAPVFQAGSSAEITFDGAAPAGFTLAPVDDQGNTAKKVIKVKFCAGSTQRSQAQLLIQSNDGQNPQIIVELIGIVENNGPPVCTCMPSTLEVAPQDTINLNANCVDPDNQPLQYAWTVERRPAGSTERITNPNSRNATFIANTATTANEPYVFRVTATDTFGTSGSCTITAFAVPRDALHIQLVWDKDETDVDLHFLNPQGSANRTGSTGFFNSPNDNYFANRTPDWGIAGQTIDNPRLDLDDTTGFGPENINLSRPISGTYTVGVHYYCDDSRGASNATVRIFCNGTLSNEFGPKNLARSGIFWDVATIEWPGCRITEIPAAQQIRTVTQGCGGF